MKKFITLLFLLILYTNSNSFSNNLNDNFSINIDIKKELKKTKIVIFEPCNYDKNTNIVTDPLSEFIENTQKNNLIYKAQTDQYAPMTIVQKDLLGNLINNIEKNLNILNIYNLQKINGICSDINNYIYDTRQDLENFIFNYYSEEIDYVVVSNLSFNPEGKLKLEIFIWDILDKRIIGAQYYIINETNIGRIANLISDFIYTKTTNEEKGIFDTILMYISETGKFKNRRKAIKIIDFNGKNVKEIAYSKNYLINPVFSRSNKNEIFYLEYFDKKANFFKENLLTSVKSLINIEDGIIFSPNFNPKDQNQVILSLSKEDGTNLVLLNLNNGKYIKLTNNSFINTSPSFSPDGKNIIYVSDKTGTRKLYKYDLETEYIEQVSKNKGVYDKPAWSPDGKLIAFVKLEKGRFKLGLMTPDGENERYLIEAYLLDSIKWSPNSRYIVYSKQEDVFGEKSIPYLYIIDIITGYEYKINTTEGEGAVDPDWISLS